MSKSEKTAKAQKEKGQEIRGSRDRPWTPRFWSGVSASGWFSVLNRNRWSVSPSRWPMAGILTFISLNNAAWWAVQQSLLGRRIAKTELVDDPIFIVGHWRSGTTLLHELMVLDPRYTYPDTYMAFAPNHFLASAWLFRPTLGLLLPKQRPMDGMAAGWDCPQEDEFALCNMGLHSPYWTAAFSNRPPQDQEYLTLDDVPPEELNRWKERLHWFLKCITVHRPQRIVLKSPPHTARVRTLVEMFPRAKFVHIVRDPYVVYPSTVNLWRTLFRDQGLQVPRYEYLNEYVFETLPRMYAAFERDRELLGPDQLSEVRYEDLVRAPLVQMQRIYEELNLGGFETAKPALEKYFADKAEYKTNRYQLDPQLRDEISRRWSAYITRYGYGEGVQA